MLLEYGKKKTRNYYFSPSTTENAGRIAILINQETTFVEQAAFRQAVTVDAKKTLSKGSFPLGLWFLLVLLTEALHFRDIAS